MQDDTGPLSLVTLEPVIHGIKNHSQNTRLLYVPGASFAEAKIS